MDNLTTTPQVGETCLSAQELHVYRHVDSEKLQSKALSACTALTNSGIRARGTVASLEVAHEKALVTAKRIPAGGVLWIA